MEDFLDLFSAVTLSIILICVTVIVTGILEKIVTRQDKEEEPIALPRRRWGKNLFF